MFNAFKIKFGSSKKEDCCSITITPVENTKPETTVENECCEVNVETNQSCCN